MESDADGNTTRRTMTEDEIIDWWQCDVFTPYTDSLWDERNAQ